VRTILDEWDAWLPKFWKLVPKDAPAAAPDPRPAAAPAGTITPAV
jgi:hypothetical protein